MRYVERLLRIAVLAGFLGGCAGTAGLSRDQAESAYDIDRPLPKVNISTEARIEYTRALQALKRKQYKQAEARLRALTRKYPQLSGPYANLGILYRRTNRTDKALEAFEKALALNPRRAETYNHLGILYRDMGEFQKARRAYQTALKLAPDYAYAHLNLGILYDLYLFDGEKALKQYERYQQLTRSRNKNVSNWIIDLRRRVKSGEALARK